MLWLFLHKAHRECSRKYDHWFRKKGEHTHTTLLRKYKVEMKRKRQQFMIAKIIIVKYNIEGWLTGSYVA